MPSGSTKNRRVATREAWIKEDTKEVQEEDMDDDMVVMEEDLLFYLIVVKWATFHDFVLSHALSMGTVTIPSMSLKFS